MPAAGGRVAVVDYQGGNLASAARALAEAATRAGIAADIRVTADPGWVRDADRVVLPGQGAFADCMRGLDAVPGLRAAIEDATGAGAPFLGICVGMQLMAGRGLEHGETEGFGWLRGSVARIEAPGLRLPQMGWNELAFTPGGHPLTHGLVPGDHGYFVHSYALAGHDPDDLVATTDYGGAVPKLSAARVSALDDDDLQTLCEATDAAILDGGGFGWVTSPGRRTLEQYFRGILLVPERTLFVGRLDGVIVGATQLLRPPRNNEAQAMAATLMHSYIAPYARGHGLARLMTVTVEDSARALGYQVLNLDVRETQAAAIRLYEGLGYHQWGTHPHYARVGGEVVGGCFFTKRLRDGARPPASAAATAAVVDAPPPPRALTLYPAIDLKDGACVRLRRGEMDDATVYSDDPGAQARAWIAAGCRWLHVVDLNGAFAGRSVNAEAIEAIIANADVPVQLGGGLRDMAAIERWLEAGIRRVILGSAAVKDPGLVREACRAHPGRVVCGIDARDGRVATEGWAEVSELSAIELALRMEDAGVAAIVFTEIARDGMLTGLDIEQTCALSARLSTPVVASGGVGRIEHLHALKAASAHVAGLEGVIVGRALYDGRVEARDALAALA